jgi:hypothetical protein
MSRPDASVDIGPFHFSYCDYDAGNDVAYLSVEAPRAAIAWESPEGHLVRLDPDTDELVGVTFLGAKRCLEAGGLRITFPDFLFSSGVSPNGPPKPTEVPRRALACVCM